MISNRLRRKIKANASWRNYKLKRETLQKHPYLKETLEDFWSEIKSVTKKSHF